MGDVSKTSTTPGVEPAGFEDDEVFERSGGDGLLPRMIHAALAIYLLPALVLVLAIGGALLLVAALARGLAASARALDGLRPRGFRVVSGSGASATVGSSRRVNPPMAARIDRQPRATPNRHGGRPGAERLN